MTQITLTALTGRTTSDGTKAVLFEAPLPAGVAGVYSTGGKIYFYGAKHAAKGDLTPAVVPDIAALVAAAVAQAMAELKKTK